MLQVQNIRKQYKTGTLIQKALDDVSLNLRDNEFVAILGPSGSGKTTLLNIIGGLDRYDSGDLIINGVSTKKYKDRDWDSYRNHTIGFVFQSYNLIPHQTILSNVELALTISNVTGAERKKRAIEALEKVGLGEQLHKKPNQLSGGQMQRVAIARALVNNPDIVLADEPTGALDSETSIQVMNLLKEVAKDRLVVMVTHNPELAEEYATRIVRLKDGKIVSDTDPFTPAPSETPPVSRNFGKAGMGWLTALSLSFNNLWTKKARTILVAFAGSIGIIGIALILSLANGVNQYIDDTERETLSEYPLEIEQSAYDMTSMMQMMQSESSATGKEGYAREVQIAGSMFGTVTKNDLRSLRTYIESGKSDIYEYTQAIEYNYNVDPYIYRIEDGDARQVNPGTFLSSMGYNMTSSYTSVYTSMFNSFHEMPENTELYEENYELKAGRWPENYNEMVVVLTEDGGITDLSLYAMGLKDADNLDDMISAFTKGEDVPDQSNPITIDYEDFIGIEFKLANVSDMYVYDSEYGVWTDKSGDTAYMNDLIANGETLKIVGVVQPSEDADMTILSTGIGYRPDLVTHVIGIAAESDIVKAQLADPSVDVLTGKEFGEDTDSDFSLENLFTIDEDALKEAFSVDTSKMSIDSSSFSNLDLSDMDFSSLLDAISLNDLSSAISQADLESLMDGVIGDVSKETLSEMFNTILADFEDYASQDSSSDITKLGDSISSYLQSDEAKSIYAATLQKIISESGTNLVSVSDLQDMAEKILTGYMSFCVANELDPSDTATNMEGYLATDEAQQILSETASTIGKAIAEIEISDAQIQEMGQQLAEGYDSYASENSMPTTEGIEKAFSDYLQSDSAQQLITQIVEDTVDTEKLQSNFDSMLENVADGVESAIQSQLSKLMQSVMNQIATKLQSSMTSAMSSLAGNLSNVFSMDPEAFANAIQMNMTQQELQELMSSLLTTTESSYEGNLQKLGYADLDDPYEIIIYPIDFDGKSKVKNIIDNYNDQMKAAGEDDKVIMYTDTVGTLMSSVTQIVDIISYVLIAFVAISLIVSSIMIGVITYISVLERRKEIGILRAMGASKHNIAQVFNAETFITGLLAGLIGVGMTLLILIPGNLILHAAIGQDNVSAVLPAVSGVILVALSVVLTLIGGLLPSKKAAKSDPVTALRTE